MNLGEIPVKIRNKFREIYRKVIQKYLPEIIQKYLRRFSEGLLVKSLEESWKRSQREPRISMTVSRIKFREESIEEFYAFLLNQHQMAALRGITMLSSSAKNRRSIARQKPRGYLEYRSQEFWNKL